MVHIDNLTDLHIDFDRILKKYIDAYPVAETNINKIKHICDNLLEDFFLEEFTIVKLVARLDNCLFDIEEDLRIIDTVLITSDIMFVLRENLHYYESIEEFEICGNMREFMTMFIEN